MELSRYPYRRHRLSDHSVVPIPNRHSRPEKDRLVDGEQRRVLRRPLVVKGRAAVIEDILWVPVEIKR